MREVALFESALQAAVPTRPDPRIAVALVPRLAEAARAATIEAESPAPRGRPRSRGALVARLGIAVALIPLVLAGLAFAGVAVPQPARSVFHAVGITLPNQPVGHAAQDGSGSTQAITPASGVTTGPEQRATAPSKGNSAAAHQHALKQREKAQGKAVGHQRGKAIGLTGASPPGQTGQTGPPAHSNAGGSSNRQGAHSTPMPPQSHVPQGNAQGHSK